MAYYFKIMQKRKNIVEIIQISNEEVIRNEWAVCSEIITTPSCRIQKVITVITVLQEKSISVFYGFLIKTVA